MAFFEVVVTAELIVQRTFVVEADGEHEAEEKIESRESALRKVLAETAVDGDWDVIDVPEDGFWVDDAQEVDPDLSPDEVSA